MKYIVKNGSQLMSLSVVSAIPQLPEGFEIVGLESEANPNGIDLSIGELEDGMVVSSLDKAIAIKLISVRAERDAKMVENDKKWLIASKKGESTVAIEEEAEALRNVPQAAEVAMEEMSLEEINGYNPFEV